MRSRPAVLAVTAALVVLTPGIAAAHPDDDEDATPGAPGIGDPYFPLDGNGGYDVKHYDLDVRYDPSDDTLEGIATIEARATQDLSGFNLDFHGLEVDSVRVDGKKATWAREAAELTVTPRKSLEEGEKFTVRIAYAGVPETVQDEFGASGFVHTDDGAVVAGQPDVAATWFPANDHPRDAASVAVSITVPEGLEAISNGVLEDRDSEDGWTTWEWRAEEPMATYLVVLAIGEFEVDEYEADGLRYWDALDPDLFTMPASEADPSGPTLGDNAAASLARQPEMIDFLAELVGDYPFDAAGGIVDDLVEMQFALETQTRSIYSPLFFGDPVLGDIVVVHELAHQWFGDDLRLHDWQHLWLNEGLATYAEWIWLEREGLVTAQQQFDDLLAVPADDPFYDALWSVPPGDPGPDKDDLFGVAIYYRGAMTHHALRLEIGDDTYRELIREWVDSQSGDTVTTDEFIALAEEVSGQQLDDLFEDWLFTPGRPASLM